MPEQKEAKKSSEEKNDEPLCLDDPNKVKVEMRMVAK